MARYRILVVDDDELLRGFYVRVLTAQGYVPVCAGNGAEAMEILDNDPQAYDLAIVDLLLPIRSGWDLIEYIRESPRHQELPLLAITGLAFSFDEFERIRELCDAVLLKGDFELGKLTETVNGLLNRRASTAPGG